MAMMLKEMRDGTAEGRATVDPKDKRRFEPLFTEKESVRKRPKIEQDIGVDMHRKRMEAS